MGVGAQAWLPTAMMEASLTLEWSSPKPWPASWANCHMKLAWIVAPWDKIAPVLGFVYPMTDAKDKCTVMAFS